MEVRGQTESYMLPSCHQRAIWSKSILVISEKKELFSVLEAFIDPSWVPKMGWYYVYEHLAWSERKHEGVGESHSASADYERHRYKSISSLIWLDAFEQSMGLMVQRESERGGKEQRAHVIFTP